MKLVEVAHLKLLKAQESQAAGEKWQRGLGLSFGCAISQSLSAKAHKACAAQNEMPRAAESSSLIYLTGNIKEDKIKQSLIEFLWKTQSQGKPSAPSHRGRRFPKTPAEGAIVLRVTPAYSAFIYIQTSSSYCTD